MANYQQPTNFQLNPSYVELQSSQQPWPRPESAHHSYDDFHDDHDDHDTSYDASSFHKSAPPPLPSSEKVGYWKSAFKHPWVLIYCMLIAIVAGVMGIQSATLGGVTGGDKFTEDYGDTNDDNEKYIPSKWLSIFQALPPICGAFGSVITGWVQDRIGRRFTLLAVGILNAISVAILLLSNALPTVDARRGILSLGMAVQGFACAGIQVTAFTYVSEISPDSMRDGNMVMMPVFSLLGNFAGAAILTLALKLNDKAKYLVPFAVGWIVGIVIVPLSLIIPDSPVYLVRSGKDARALRSVERLLSSKVNTHTEMERIRHAVEEEMLLTKNVNYLSCFKGVNLRRTLIILLVSSFPAFLGMEVLGTATIFLKTIGIESESTRMLFTTIGGLLAIVCLLLGTWVGSFTGLRRATLVSLVLTGCAWAVMGISGFFGGKIAPWIGALSLYGVLIFSGLGVWPASFAYMGSLSSLQLRALTQGVSGVASQAASAIMGAVMPQLYLEDAANLGAKVGFVFVGTCLIGAVLTWFFLPEIKGRDVNEINKMFEARLPARKFRNWKLADSHLHEEAVPLATS